MRTTGTVKWFDDKKGYGFILSEEVEGDIFVHYSVIEVEGYRSLVEGQDVTFVIGENEKGKFASEVQKVLT